MKLDEQLKRIKELLTEQEGHSRPGGGGSTSTNSSGQYISADAWVQGGILTDDGRQEDIGDLPLEVDITGGDSEEITISVDDVFGEDPAVDMVDIIDDLIDGPGHPTKPRQPKGIRDVKLDTAPCCEPCGDGMWKKCNTDDCIYGSISDCELVDQEGESNLESLSLTDIWSDE
tara:strand:- start:832 stop:1350 length:519 start_codon:yes stop_codon:yes gene_type:complete